MTTSGRTATESFVISGATRLVGLIGDPVEASLSPRMQNAAFAARALDWAYVPLRVSAERLPDAVRGLAALAFAGANVTTPHKQAIVELCEADSPSVNTLVMAGGHILGRSTDAAVLAGISSERPVILGNGGSARAFAEALPHARCFARRAEWPPDSRDADLVVNATSARDTKLVELRPDQTLIELPYPDSPTATAAREAGATVIGGLEVLVAQGVAAFELWTGEEAPIEVMRRAVGLTP